MLQSFLKTDNGGGHEQAAGVTLPAENEEAFRQRLQAAVAKYDEALFLPAQLYDEAVSLSECTRELHQQLALLAPFGCENPSPLLLVEDAWPIEHRAVGSEGAHLKLSLRQNERILPGIAFSMGSLAARMPDRVDAVFALDINEFRGETTLQAQVKALRPVRDSLMEQLSQPDGIRQQEALLNHLTGGFALLAGKPTPKGEYGYFNASVEDLTAAARESARGLLILTHTNATAYQLMQLNPDLTLCDRGLPDPRCFATLMHQPRWETLQGHWRQVFLADGEAFPGQVSLLRQQLPDAVIHVLPRTPALADLCASLDAGDDLCRRLYKAMRTMVFRSAAEAAAYAGMTAPQVETALHAFSQLGLISYQERPFGYTLLPPVKCRMDDSEVVRYLRAIH